MLNKTILAIALTLTFAATANAVTATRQSRAMQSRAMQSYDQSYAGDTGDEWRLDHAKGNID